MTRKKRTLAFVIAGVGWSAAIGITIASQHVAVLRDNPYLFTRLFLLCSTIAAVLTLGLWFERILAPVIDTVFNLGIRAGRRMGKFDKLTAGTVPSPSSARDSGWWAQPVNGQGQQDTPPTEWLRR